MISLDAGDTLQSTLLTGNGHIPDGGLAAASLPAAATYTEVPTFKSTNVAGLATFAPYVDMVKQPLFAFYRTTFSLPSGFSEVSFTFEALFDNEVEVLLNGTPIAIDNTGLGPGCTACAAQM